MLIFLKILGYTNGFKNDYINVEKNDSIDTWKYKLANKMKRSKDDIVFIFAGQVLTDESRNVAYEEGHGIVVRFITSEKKSTLNKLNNISHEEAIIAREKAVISREEAVIAREKLVKKREEDINLLEYKNKNLLE